MPKSKAWIWLALLTLALACGDYRPTSMGYPYRIFVVADSALWQEVHQPFSDVFEGEVLTPISEKKFYFTWIPLEKLNEFKQRMNFFFVGVLDEKGATNDYLKKIVPAEFQQGVREGKYFYFFKDDLFAREQIALFMIGRNREALLENFKRLKKEIYHKFEAKYFARLEKSMFEKGEQNALEEYIAKNFDFTIRVQHDYFVAIEEPEVPYLWLRRFDPDRWVSIWRLPGDSSLLNDQALADIRDRFTKKYYQGDYIVREDMQLEQVDFNGQKTYRLSGVWRNDSVMVGGPFRLYALHYPQDSLVYFVDLAVMGPGKLKKPFLDQLEVIARTFRRNDAR